MINFSVLIFGNHIPQHELEVAVQSFARFFHSVTNKHQRKLKLMVACDREHTPLINSLAEKYKLKQALREESFLSKEALLSHNSLGIVPASGMSKRYATAAFLKGLPILGYIGFSLNNLVDNSCGMLIPYKSREHNIEAFSDILQQLFFDPEALKMLQKGAERRGKLLTVPDVGVEQELFSQVA